MTIFDTSPELSQKWKPLQKAINDIDAIEGLGEVGKRFSDIGLKRLFLQYEVAGKRLWGTICEHPLCDNVKEQFLSAVTADLERPTHNSISINLRPPYAYTGCKLDAWFSARTFSGGNLLEEKRAFEVLHPDLLTLSEELWETNPKVTIGEFFQNQSGASWPPVDPLSEKYTLESWAERTWAREALGIAERGLEVLKFSLRLSDFVKWTCSDRKFPNQRFDAEFSPPSLLADCAQFGARLIEQADFKRIDHLPVWKTSNGEFVSPFWEYLGWCANTGKGEDEIYNCISRIGGGIDAQTILNSPEHEDFSQERLQVFLDSVFRAGQAETRLRLKLDLEGAAISGLSIAVGREKGSTKGGDANAERIRALKEDILNYIPAALSQVGLIFLGQTTAIQAEKLRELALADRPNDYIGPKGPLSLVWFSDAVEYLKAGTEFGGAVAAALSQQS